MLLISLKKLRFFDLANRILNRLSNQRKKRSRRLLGASPLPAPPALWASARASRSRPAYPKGCHPSRFALTPDSAPRRGEKHPQHGASALAESKGWNTSARGNCVPPRRYAPALAPMGEGEPSPRLRRLPLPICLAKGSELKAGDGIHHSGRHTRKDIASNGPGIVSD